MNPPGQTLGSLRQSSFVVGNFIVAFPCKVSTFMLVSTPSPDSTYASCEDSKSAKLLCDEKLEKSRRCFSINIRTASP